MHTADQGAQRSAHLPVPRAGVASCVPHSLLFSVSTGNHTELRSSCLQGKRFTKCELFPQTYLCFLSATVEFILMST